MEDRELFMEVFNNLRSSYRRLGICGTIVSYDDEDQFNIDGYNLAYNLYRLTRTLANHGEFE